MGIFDRLATLFKSNINDLISRAENPEKMLDQIVADMKGQLASAKQQVAAAIADEKRLRDQAETEARDAKDWEQKAMLALRENREDLARQALVRQGEHEQHAQQLQSTWQAHALETEKLKNQLRDLNDKIEEAKRKKNVLVARKKRAEAQKAIHETMQGLSNDSAFDTFNRMEEKIVQMEAEADAQTEVAEQYSGDALSQRFKDLEVSKGADMALDELKRKMGVAPPAAATAQGPTNVRVSAVTEEAAHTEASEEAELEAALTAAKARRQNG